MSHDLTGSAPSRAPAWRKLASAVRGRVIAPADPDYDAARRVYNGAVDRRPAVIVRCRGAADVAACIRTARAEGLPLAVRGGGHSVPGFGVCDGGLCIDLTDMRAVHVDTREKVLVAQAGATWRDVDHEAQAFGLATTGARISSVGIGGVTLGGGYGWLMRRYGLAVDNLLSADLVTADGELLAASHDRRADLFWGLRGGGGNFGVVTQFRYRLHPLDHPIVGGTLFYDASRAPDTIAAFVRLMADADDDLGGLFTILIGPPFLPAGLRHVPIVALSVCHIGTPHAAEIALGSLRRLRPTLDLVAPMPYARLQRLFDAAGVFGNRASSRTGHIGRLSDAAMKTWLTHAMEVPSPQSIAMLSPLGGAVRRVGESDTAFSFRETAYDYAANAVWPPDDDHPRYAAWAAGFGEAMRPFTTGCYVNEADGGGAPPPYRQGTHDRLVAVKRAYDPMNVFRLNYNISPDAPGDATRQPRSGAVQTAIPKKTSERQSA